MRDAMTGTNAIDTKVLESSEADGEYARYDAIKARPCLKCQSTFESQWSGERICPRCKGSSTWREGISAEFISSGGRR